MVGPPILASEPETTRDLECKSQDTRHNVNQFGYHGMPFVIQCRYTSYCN
jgi:hypothetical protein